MSVDAITSLGGNAAAERAEANRQAWNSTYDEIREKGFMSYVEDLEKKKMEEMREKILAAMGLTEEDLGKMSADQRAAVEDAVAQEIRRRLEAASLVNQETGKDDAATDGETTDTSFQPGLSRLDTTLIQMLQEARTAAETAEERTGTF